MGPTSFRQAARVGPSCKSRHGACSQFTTAFLMAAPMCNEEVSRMHSMHGTRIKYPNTQYCPSVSKDICTLRWNVKVVIEIVGDLVSKPYIDITLHMMKYARSAV